MDGWMVLKMPSLASLNELCMVSTTRKTTTKWQFSLPTVLASQIRPDFIKNILTFDRYCYFPNVTRQNIEVLLSLLRLLLSDAGWRCVLLSAACAASILRPVVWLCFN